MENEKKIKKKDSHQSKAYAQKSEKGLRSLKEGYRAEKIAVLFLKIKGYQILARNFRPRRGIGAGEIDIIAKKKDFIIFVEVKYRQDKSMAAESVSSVVQQRQIKGAEYFLMQRPEFCNKSIRFDVILMSPQRLPEHIQNAFTA